MKTGPIDSPDQIIKQYLLGQLSDSDKENLEHEYLVEAAALHKVEMGEDELIDEYLDKQLSPDERQSFLQIFLTTKDREEKLRLAKALRGRVRKNAGGLERMSRRLRIPTGRLVRLGQGSHSGLAGLNCRTWLALDPPELAGAKPACREGNLGRTGKRAQGTAGPGRCRKHPTG